MGCIQSELRTSKALLPLVQWLENSLYFNQCFLLLRHARSVSNPVTRPRHMCLKGEFEKFCSTRPVVDTRVCLLYQPLKIISRTEVPWSIFLFKLSAYKVLGQTVNTAVCQFILLDTHRIQTFKHRN